MRKFNVRTPEATCQDAVDRPCDFVLRCQGGAKYAADGLNGACPCGMPPVSVVRMPEDLNV